MRVHYVDITRGFAVFWMISIQLFDMYYYEDFHYGVFYNMAGRYVNWVPLFFIIVGVSLALMTRKYDVKSFLKRNLFRGIKFILVGGFLIWWCGFRVEGFFGEVLSSIGLSLIFALPLFAIAQIHKRFNTSFIFLICSFLMLALDNWFHDPQAFSPLWILSMICFGGFVGGLVNYYNRNIKRIALFVAISLSIPIISIFSKADYFSRNYEFWFINVYLFFLFILLSLCLQKVGKAGRFFSYFGRHALFFYVFHFLIFLKILQTFDLVKLFSMPLSSILTAFSIIGLVFLQKGFEKINLEAKVSNTCTRAFWRKTENSRGE